MARKRAIPDVNVFSKAWSEIKKINWHEINQLTQQNFHIGLVGSELDIADMLHWLQSFPYHAKNPDKVSFVPVDAVRIKKCVARIIPEQGELKGKMIQSCRFCIAAPHYLDEVRKYKTDVYLFDPDDFSFLPAQILSNHQDIRFGLAYHFPVFRPKQAQREIENTALQNAFWVLLAGLPQTMPNLQSPLTAPLELLTDLTVLTANEFKMMFGLTGIAGQQVRPLNRAPEFVFIIAMAGIAQGLANGLINRIPLGMRLIAKAALAYAFTWAIGEAIFYRLTYRRRLAPALFANTLRQRYIFGLEAAKEWAQNGGDR